jgi:hypothetical protein
MKSVKNLSYYSAIITKKQIFVAKTWIYFNTMKFKSQQKCKLFYIYLRILVLYFVKNAVYLHRTLRNMGQMI